MSLFSVHCRLQVDRLARFAQGAAGRLRWSDEAQLQDGLSQAFAAGGIVLKREVRISAADRLDFALELWPADGDTGTLFGVEVKVRGQRAELERQVARYLAHPRVVGMVVVTPTLRLSAGWRDEIDGKPVAVAYLGQL